jgi:predicted  nucleic acid-binding Zn-ribbon protein
VGLHNCTQCGTLFLKRNSELCPECTQAFNETYRRIRDYLRTNPNKTLWDVHADLNLSLSVVQQVMKFAENQEKK